MASLKSNLVKRVQRLPKPSNTTAALQPLFEAVSNSIHSTQTKYKDSVAQKGEIYVSVDTDASPLLITVEDNGVGLDEHHYEAFTTTDTDHKIKIGGKGVGRLLWLDCFKDIKVSSIYKEGDNHLTRSFSFKLSNEEQITEYKFNRLTDKTETGCFIRFEGLRSNSYASKFPSRPTYIFYHFTSHFLPIFISGKSPRIVLNTGDNSYVYPDEINEIVYKKSDNIEIQHENYGPLKLTLMECDKVASSDLKGSHFVHFIAHDRTVHSQKIDGKLGLKYFGSDNNRVFQAILTGKYLDENVNQERTAFTFSDSVIEDIISDVCFDHIEEFLKEPLNNLRENQKRIINTITQTYPSVAYGDVNELQDKVPSGELKDDAIYGHLSRERFRRDQRQAEKITAVLQRLKNDDINPSDFSDAIAEAGQAIEDAEQRSLAEYIVRRKVVLDFIELLLEKVRDDESDSSYQREDILHSFICPLRVNSLSSGRKVEPAASHDLWVIDERLTFAQYFSSDTEFRELSQDSKSGERPDLLIFDHVHGLRQTEDPSKVLLVEFKKPGRKSYNTDENPQHQVERYVRNLLSGNKIDVRGRPIQLAPDTVFYCFIVADIVGKLDEWTYSWLRTADGRGRFYQPQNGFRGSIELIGWDALLEDAKARNQAFFDKAGITGESVFNKQT